MAVFDRLIAEQRGYLFPWVPVAMAFGIGGYFALAVEPGRGLFLGIAALAGLLLLLAWRGTETWRPVAAALLFAVIGFGLAAGRAHWVAAPVLEFRYYGPIEGRLVEVDRSLSDKLRLTLDQVVLFNTPPHRTPAMVRVSLHGDGLRSAPVPGQRLILTGHLSAPMGPAEPGGFDFRRLAWFERLGAVGYTRSPVLVLDPAPQGGELWVNRQRLRLSKAIQAELPGQRGAFAAAILTGDRSGLERPTIDAMRATNLAHLLAISGLHMGLLTGFVFLVLRYAIALWPWLSLRINGKKLAAFMAMVIAAGYLAMSGGNVATQRAFVMVAVMLGAVLLDRRALTLRAVALAAVIILAMRPEALLSPGFQMSFAATTALVYVFSNLRGFELWRRPAWVQPVVAVVVSSSVAGIATAPVGAAHFNQVAQYGLIANLIAVPVMGMLVMPMAVLAGCLAPFGLSWLGLEIMALGIDWILFVAHRIADLPGAVRGVMAPPGIVLTLIACGALWGILWRGGLRYGGLAGILAGLWLWTQAERPHLLIAQSGALVGVMGPEGRIINKPRGDGFVARSWLENDGDRASQADAAGRGGAAGPGFSFALGQIQALQFSNRQAKATEAPCGAAQFVITIEEPATWPKDAHQACAILSAHDLAKTGSLALDMGKDGVARISSAVISSGARLWSGGAQTQPKIAQLREELDQLAIRLSESNPPAAAHFAENANADDRHGAERKP